MVWLLFAAGCSCLASVLGLLSVHYCFGRTVMLFFTGMSLTALVLVVSSTLHL